MVVFEQSVLLGHSKWQKVVVFGQKVEFEKTYSNDCKSGCIWAKVVVFGQKWFVFGQSACIRAKWLYLGEGCCIRANWLYS